MLKTHKFARKTFYVDGVRVTPENMEEVAKWCGGEILTDPQDGQYIKVRVHRPLTDRQTKAFVGDWVLYAGTGFKVYTAKAFDKSFEKVRTLTKAQADEAGIKVPHEKSQRPKRPVPSALRKKPANPVLDAAGAEAIRKQQEDFANQMEQNADDKPLEGDEVDKLFNEVLKG